MVSADEREGGIRAILNLGHTFGHAIETAQGYGQWLHGEAVAMGMLLALELSARRGWIAAAEVAGLRSLLLASGLPVHPPADMAARRFPGIDVARQESGDGRLRLVLLEDIGRACIVDDVTERELVELLESHTPGG